MLSNEEIARVEMMFDLAFAVRTWTEGTVSADNAMKRVHRALLNYKEAL